MTNDKLSPSALAQFTGSEHWYRHGLVREYRGGMWERLAEEAGIDATLARKPGVSAEGVARLVM